MPTPDTPAHVAAENDLCESSSWCDCPQGECTRGAIEEQFTHHAPHGNQVERYEELRGRAKYLATLIFSLCPASADRQKALDRLREAIMWANASIAINEPPPELAEPIEDFELPVCYESESRV